MKHLLLIVCAAGFIVSAARDLQAQHEGHLQPEAATAGAANTSCAEGARKALTLADAAPIRRNSAAGSREEIDRELAQLQRVVTAAQAELFTCRAAVPAAVTTPPSAPIREADHSKMNMGGSAAGAKPPAATTPAARGAKPADPMAGMDHSKMNMGAPAAGGKPPAAGTKPAARGAKSADPMAGMDHSKMGAGGAPSSSAAAPSAGAGAGKLPVMMAERIADPGCPDKVGQAEAPKTVYARKVYYFCSAAARDEFRKDPAAYLKKHPR